MNLTRPLLLIASALNVVLVVWTVSDGRYLDALLWAGIAALNLTGALVIDGDNK